VFLAGRDEVGRMGVRILTLDLPTCYEIERWCKSNILENDATLDRGDVSDLDSISVEFTSE
jgi:hypothetical protein